ncbi:MAG: prepilin-type N-terminal cleavage/methylation domain-containing protein [Sedimentisphaerales bacterium]
MKNDRGTKKYDIRTTSHERPAARDDLAFTLVEILIVTALLGILAAVVIPSVADSTTSAKGSALATDLQLLRRFILVYKAQHLEVGPGYPNGQTTAAPTEQALVDQATLASNSNGQTAAPGTPGFNRGPYMQKLPANPFNGKNTVQMLGNGEAFPADADDSHGWVYKAATSEIRADNTGTDINGKRYYDY